MIKVIYTEESGRGLYATQDIQANECIIICEILLLNEEDTIKVNNTSLKYYTFKFDTNRDCLVLGLGEIFNHLDDANVNYNLVYHDNRFFMEFRSNTIINKGEQLFIDYTADSDVDVSSYIKTKSLVG